MFCRQVCEEKRNQSSTVRLLYSLYKKHRFPLKATTHNLHRSHCLKKKKKRLLYEKNLESSSKPSSVTVCMKKMWCNDHTQNARREKRDNPLFSTLVSFHITLTALTLTHLQRYKYQTLQHAISIQRAKPGWVQCPPFLHMNGNSHLVKKL